MQWKAARHPTARSGISNSLISRPKHRTIRVETTRVKSIGGSPMPRRVAFLVLVVIVAGCEDQPTTRPNRPNNLASVPTPLPDPNNPPKRLVPVDPYYVVPPIIKSFDGEVVAKEPDRF